MNKDIENKDDTHKDNIYFIIFGIIIAAIFVPWIIDFLIFGNNVNSNITNGEWASFLGSYIGGICTLIAVFISIKDNNEKILAQKKENDSIRKEEKRLSVQPYIASDYYYYYEEKCNVFVWFTIDVIDIADDNGTVVNKTNVDFKYSYPSIDFREYYTPIVCKMKNAGAGSAVEGQLTIRSETNSKQLSLTIAKDETTYIVIFTSLRYNGWIEIGYYYRDIANICSYKLVDSIRFFQNENNETVFEFPNNQKSVQVINVD